MLVNWVHAWEESVLPGVSRAVEKAFAQMVVEKGPRGTPIRFTMMGEMSSTADTLAQH